MKNTKPIVAIVGPPNAGKSTLLNKIAGGQIAVTSEVAGTTRDRQYTEVLWNGRAFTLVDTAGLDLGAEGELETNVQKQIEKAVKEADLLVMVVDSKEPATALDHKVLTTFRKLKTKKLLAINKVDSPKRLESSIETFKRFGIKPVYAVSAVTGRGIGDLLDAILELIPASTETDEQTNKGIAVSIVGKPNVGKSSLFNNILKDERAVVSAIPGTTRTAIDDHIVIDGTDFTFIDTAGLKKKDHRQSKPDVFSTFQTFKAIRRSDVCLLVIDATEEITVQDQRIAREILDMQKGCVIILSKIDKFSQSEKKLEITKRAARDGKNQSDNEYGNLQDYVSHHFPFLWMCPVFFVSSFTDEGITEALKAVKPIYEKRNKVIDNQTLSEFLASKLKTNPPKLLRDQKPPKVFSLKQLDSNPPTFELLVNHPAAISLQFRKFLENSMIKELDFWGTPIKLHLKKKIG
ncbi:MAG: ribosome biogenesis GTPase Der [Candidatus Doudnabacteria bacterium]|nr:ribosome biogenesis GTPase Der [Candidatus Doudnabacteria bacterium]